MRQSLRILGFGFLSLVSLETAVAIIDWSARWDWFTKLMVDHPHLAAFIRTPFSYLVLIVVGFAFLFIEGRLKTPKLAGRVTNLHALPDTATTTMAMLFIEEKKEPGWNEQPLNWHWFARIKIVNESEIPTTVDAIEVRIKWKWKRRKLFTKCIEDFGTYVFAGHNSEGWPKDDEIPNLLQTLKSIPLTHGIGHEGWVRFDISKMSRKEMEVARIDFWIVDAMQGKHKLRRDDSDIKPVNITKRLSH
jgi:hypothetical protein